MSYVRNFVTLKLYVEVMCISYMYELSYTLKFVPQVIRKSCEYNFVTLFHKLYV
jgi:hypothetical protein